jgi:LysM repeat protein
MQSRWLYLPAASLFAAFSSCTNTGTTASNAGSVGPFDARGNYVEAWADNPSKWRKGGSTEIVEAEPDRAAADVPVVPPAVIAANATPRPVASTTTTVYRPKTATVSNPKPKTGSTASSSRPKPKTAVVVKPKVKPKAVAKSKPKATRHTVRSGDSLYAIAKRYGTTASAVQKANGLKGTVIRPGQSLTIPK